MKNKNNVTNPINLPILFLGMATVVVWVVTAALLSTLN
jgi:hypothetical protein